MLYHLSYTPERAPNAATPMSAISARAATMTTISARAATMDAIMTLTATIALTLAAANG